MIISKDAEKSFEKIQHWYMIKTLIKLGKERNFLSLIKSIYQNPTTNISNEERSNVFPLTSGNLHAIQGCTEGPNQCKEKKKERKKMHTNWKEIKQSIHRGYDCLYRKSQASKKKKKAIIIGKFSKQQDTKSTYKNQYFYI